MDRQAALEHYRARRDEVYLLARAEEDAYVYVGLEDLGFAEELRSDPDFILEVMSIDVIDAVGYASKELMCDRSFVMAAVSQRAYSLNYVSDALKQDREIVMKAVENNGFMLQDVLEELKSDRSIVMTAVMSDPDALQFAADVLLEDETFAPTARQRFYFFKIVNLAGRFGG
eukprot:2304105-Amphidinium_carterae.2